MDNNGANNGTGASTAASASVNPLDKLESAIAAAQQSAQNTGAPAGTPQEQFSNQFGSGEPSPVGQPPASADAKPVTADTASKPEDSTISDTQLSEIKSAAELLAQNPKDLAIQAAAEDLKKQISDSVDKFLEEVTKEKTAA